MGMAWLEEDVDAVCWSNCAGESIPRHEGEELDDAVGFGQRGQSFAGVRVEFFGVDRVGADVALDLAERDLAVRGP
jgi:hypothetical protein